MKHFDRPFRIIFCWDIDRFISHDGTVPLLPMNADAEAPQKTNFTTSDNVVLEAEYIIPSSCSAIAVLSHPHPLYGGDMRNIVIQDLFNRLPEASIAALRYNFRGVQNSAGSHGDGETEVFDSQGAFRFASALGQGKPVISVGYSFGADVSMTADHPTLAGWVGIAAPLALLAPQEMSAGADTRPTKLLVPENDQFRSVAEAREICTNWKKTSIEAISGADHFFSTGTKTLSERVADFVVTFFQ